MNQYYSFINYFYYHYMSKFNHVQVLLIYLLVSISLEATQSF